MTKMKDKDKQILYILGAIIILAAVYFLIFNNFNEKKAALQEQNATLSQEVQTLESMVANKQNVLDDTELKTNQVKEIIAKFPSEIRIQNVITHLHDMSTEVDDVDVKSESYTMNTLFSGAAADGTDPNAAAATDPNAAATAAPETTVAPITNDTTAGEIVAAASGYTGYRSDIVVNFSTNYDSLKDVIDYINNSQNRMTITSMNATSNDNAEGSAELDCTMTVTMYSIANTGNVYSEPTVDGINTGKNDLFKK